MIVQITGECMAVSEVKRPKRGSSEVATYRNVYLFLPGERPELKEVGFPQVDGMDLFSRARALIRKPVVAQVEMREYNNEGRSRTALTLVGIEESKAK